ncbi:MAG: RNA polymerase sigma factor [Acidobacteriota bacterium]
MEPDVELVERCRRKDDGAWTELILTHRREVCSLCYRYCGREDEAEDLAQEIFLKVFKSIDGYDPSRASFATWLNRVTRNHLVDYYRRTRMDRLTFSLEDELPRLKDDHRREEHPSAQAERSERREVLQTALGNLSPGLRQAVILRDLQGLQYTKISEVLGVPPGTVKSRVHRGRLELGRVLSVQLGGLMQAAAALSY